MKLTCHFDDKSERQSPKYEHRNVNCGFEYAHLNRLKQPMVNRHEMVTPIVTFGNPDVTIVRIPWSVAAIPDHFFGEYECNQELIWGHGISWPVGRLWQRH